MTRELNVLALFKGTERFIFVYDDDSRDDAHRRHPRQGRRPGRADQLVRRGRAHRARAQPARKVRKRNTDRATGRARPRDRHRDARTGPRRVPHPPRPGKERLRQDRQVLPRGPDAGARRSPATGSRSRTSIPPTGTRGCCGRSSRGSTSRATPRPPIARRLAAVRSFGKFLCRQGVLDREPGEGTARPAAGQEAAALLDPRGRAETARRAARHGLGRSPRSGHSGNALLGRNPRQRAGRSGCRSTRT